MRWGRDLEEERSTNRTPGRGLDAGRAADRDAGRAADRDAGRAAGRDAGRAAGRDDGTGRNPAGRDPAGPAERLQREVGNQGVQALATETVQPKLVVGPPDDEYEREADRVADAITGGDERVSTVLSRGAAAADPLRRECASCQLGGSRTGPSEEETELRRDGDADGTPSVGADLEGRIRSLQGGGRRLRPDVRSYFEPRFGRSLGDVRVHTGSEADRVARSIDARAFTVGRDVAFRSGEYRPESESGKRLMAHELTHVLQQRGGATGGGGRGTGGDETAARVAVRRKGSSKSGSSQSGSSTEESSSKSRAQELIDAHTNWGGANLNETSLAGQLLSQYLVKGDAEMVHAVLDELSSRNVDDVSRQMIVQASDDQLDTAASTKPGRDVLRRMVRELQAGWSWGDGDKMGRVMDAITENQPSAEDEERDDHSRGGGQRVEVKVVTFKEGALDPDWIEGIRFWPKGHTALIVGGYVYSFSNGWQCGMTETEYKAANEWRGAWVQVLDIVEKDAKQIQSELNAACDSGVYGAQGVCTSNSAKFLQDALEGIDSTWSPKKLKNQLAGSGHVDRTYEWKKKEDGGSGKKEE